MARRSAYQPLLLSDGLHAAAARSPAKAALICDGTIRSYGVLAARIRRVCGGAQALGIRKGDRAAVLAPNCIEYPELVVGLSDAGAVVATLNARSTSSEIAAACDDCGARLLFVHPSLADVAHTARFATIQRIVVLGDEYEAWLAASAESAPLESIDETDPFTLVYSSGTTGKPKGIVISHRSRSLTFHGMAMEYGCYGPDDYQLGIAPMAHGAGFVFIMASLYFGGAVEVLPRFDPAQVVTKLATEPFTGVFMVPTHFQAIFGLESTLLEKYRGGSGALRTIMSNAAALPQAVKEKIVGFWGEGRLHETYGSTEAGVVTNLRPQYQLSRKQSVGPAFALNTIRLLDDDGQEVDTGAVGELYSRSPYLFNGYWDQPEETAKVVRDGWVTAGDLARQDDHGFYYIVDRKKDMVITGGLNVYPREIEEVLHKHPALIEAAVVGVPDDYFGEALRAFVVLRPGMNVEPIELESHCRATLAGYKIPKEFRFVDVLPRNAGGKVLKNSLRARSA
jgi:long-chain acyl-CoA synthetase